MPTDPAARRARPWRAFALTLVLAAGAWALERQVPATWGAPTLAPATPPGFDAVDMRGARPAELDRAFAWRSVLVTAPRPREVGEVAVALTPADDGPPILWFPQRKRMLSILPPERAPRSARVLELRAFADGLAPARLESRAENVDGWGYVDAEGRWVIAPHFKDAGSFAGGLAVVQGDDGLQLIDVHGTALPWRPENVSNTPGVGSVAKTRLTPFGRWTAVVQAGAWVVVDNGRAAGEPSWVTDGRRVIRVPGVNAKASADGELWLVDTDAGPRLWTPEHGVIPTPAGFTPTQAMAAGLFLAPSKKDATSALVALDGRVVADPAPVLRALTPERFLACTTPVAGSAFDAADGGRTVGPDLPDGRCGILDARGQWWLRPDYRTIDRWSDSEVLAQGEAQSCVVALFEPAAGCASGDGPSPRLDVGRATPRLYRYVDRNGNDASAARYSGAWPFAGKVAEATAQGLPGLVDADGRWLTPRPEGDVFVRAQQAALVAQRHATTAAGLGVIDRQGSWVVPPVFAGLSWLPDGSLRACPAGADFDAKACEHLDAHGKRLDTPAAPLPPPAPATPPSAPAQPAEPVADGPVAVARNGRWGFRDAHGEWTIPPRFDDATDFDGDRAAAAVAVAASAAPADGTPAPARRWGLVGLDGRWVAEPRFARLDRFQGTVAVAAEDGLLGLVDRDGRWVAKPEFAAIAAFDGGVATAKRPDGTLCALDTAGHCQGEAGVTALERGTDRWTIATQTRNGVEQRGYLDAQNHWAIAPRFLWAEPFQGELAIVRAELPPLPAESPQRWIAVEVQRHVGARLFAVGAVHPSNPMRGLELDPPRFALADDQGHWLVPTRPGPAPK